MSPTTPGTPDRPTAAGSPGCAPGSGPRTRQIPKVRLPERNRRSWGTGRFTGRTGVVGIFLPADPGGADDLAKHGEIVFDQGLFWFKGQNIRTGQANVKPYNRQLRDLVPTGRATPSRIVSHELPLQRAPEAY